MLVNVGLLSMVNNLKKYLWRWNRILRSRLDIGSRMQSPDRLFQESRLLPEALRDCTGHKVLYVGVSWYTYHYYRKYFDKVRLTTLDVEREQAVYGCRQHVIGGLDAPQLLGRAPFDAVFLLGILGYGINDNNQLVQGLRHLDRLLSVEGRCYLTVEERATNAASRSLNPDSAIQTIERAGFQIAPISGWQEMAGSVGRTRFYAMTRSGQSLQSLVARFAP